MRALSRVTMLLPVAFLGSALLAGPSWAASFDCAKATASDEKAVCANPRLSTLDELMGKAYAQARTKADDRAAALSDVRAFLSRRHACGTDTACLTVAYVVAIGALGFRGSDVAVPDEISALDLVGAVPAETGALPGREGQCAATRITALGGRLSGDTTFETGATVRFANGGAQVSYDRVPGVIQSRPGDRVLMCLVGIPKGCPPGDDRGREYRTTNLRTRATWSLPDSEHSCGGA